MVEVVSNFPWDACGTPRKNEQFQSPPIGLRTISIDYFYRFSIILLPPNVSERAKFVPCQFPTRRLGCLVNQRNPSGCWQVTGSDLADLGQIISFYFGFFPS